MKMSNATPFAADRRALRGDVGSGCGIRRAA
jgi:hypothetical protein